MKQLFYIIFFYAIALCGCQNDKYNMQKRRLKLLYEVIPEDSEGKTYSILWEDTLGQSEGYLPLKVSIRPREIWCVITNRSNDTLGHYWGLSTAQTFTYFETMDTIVNLNFMAGINMFPDKSFASEYEFKVWWQKNKIDYKPIVFNTRLGLRKKHKLVLEEK